MRRFSSPLITAIFAITVAAGAQAQSGDPPARVGRISQLTGNVSLYPVGDTAWTGASVNYPLTAGDALWADTSARTEVQLGSSALRVAPLTSLVFGEISDTVTQVRIDQGSIDVHVRYLSDDEIYEIDTPAGVISLVDEGHYRIDVTPDGKRATITVRDGAAEVARGDSSLPVAAQTSVVLLEGNRPPITTPAIPEDEWEQWADARAADADAVQATDYVSRDMVGYEDLDRNGTWQVDATYGNIWIPGAVAPGWAPYRFGHWESVAPWGWTWIDDASWGFAPFHYGRWAYVTGRWAWVPGSIHLRPVYAPALVAFVNGPGWSVGVSSGPGVGWIPLAPGEVYVPGYRASPGYLQRINVANVDVARVDASHFNVTHMEYANRSSPNGVTVVPRDVFLRARPIQRSAVAVRAADVAAAEPSNVPFAGGQRIVAPEHTVEPAYRARNGVAPHPPVANAHTEPAPPPRWSPRPRPVVAAAPSNAPSARPMPPTGPPARPAAPPPGSADLRSRPLPPPAADNTREWQDRRQQLVARQQQEAAALAAHHQQQLQTAHGNAAQQLRQQQQQEKEALSQRQQKERDQLDRQYRKSGGH